MSLFEELKRRNVFRMGFAYLVLGWLLLQVTDVVVPILELPDWVAKLVLFLLAIGFPIVLFFAWAFELTPEGLKREKDVDRSQSIAPQTGRKLDRAIIGILVIAVAVLLLDRFIGQTGPDNPGKASTATQDSPADEQADAESSSPAPTDQNEQSVAVLPFVNMSDDKQNEYFSDGISEELLNVLVRVDGLRVPSRTSSFTFKGSDMKLSEIGRELGVDHVLEGSVRKAGDRIRVTAQLIDVNTDTHLWSETFTRELDDVFAVQDEIAQAIVSALKLTLTGEEKSLLEQRPTENIEAYNLYLLGRHQWNLRIPGRMAEALDPLQKAVALDPDFDQAWAALADVYLLLPEYQEGTVAENIPLALAATEKALAINPDSARALTTSAYIKAMYQYDWRTAEQEFLRAIDIEPMYVTAHQWYAEMLAAQRRTDEAMEQLDEASRVDPLAPIIPHIKGWVALWADRLEDAESHFLEAIRLDPGFPYAIGNLSQTYVRQGKYDLARERQAEVGELLDTDFSRVFQVIDALENPELKASVIATLMNTEPPTQPFDVPVYFAQLGELDLALDLLIRNFEAGGAYSPHVNRMLILDPLREDPRFQQLLAKMNLWP